MPILLNISKFLNIGKISNVEKFSFSISFLGF